MRGVVGADPYYPLTAKTQKAIEDLRKVEILKYMC